MSRQLSPTVWRDPWLSSGIRPLGYVETQLFNSLPFYSFLRVAEGRSYWGKKARKSTRPDKVGLSESKKRMKKIDFQCALFLSDDAFSHRWQEEVIDKRRKGRTLSRCFRQIQPKWVFCSLLFMNLHTSASVLPLEGRHSLKTRAIRPASLNHISLMKRTALHLGNSKYFLCTPK